MKYADLLTDEEMGVLEHLRLATKSFFELPEHHPSDYQEWAADIHHLQSRVMMRAALRARPDYFTPMQPRKRNCWCNTRTSEHAKDCPGGTQ